MTEPLVCAILLTKDRPEMAKRAVECFRSQTYPRKTIMVLLTDPKGIAPETDAMRGEFTATYNGAINLTIGELRNGANHCAVEQYQPDIFIHFDDDDWSHPNRIAEQVALLQLTKAECVGYQEMFFWDSRGTGETWHYLNRDHRYCVGSSLCYTRAAWERKPFKALPVNSESLGEDTEFIRDRESVGVYMSTMARDKTIEIAGEQVREPRMICSIHGKNSTSYAGIEKSGNWKRVSEWDAHCRSIMTL